MKPNSHLGDRFKNKLHFLKAYDFVAQHGHINCYQANTKKPEYGMLSHLPGHFKDQHMVSWDNKVNLQ